MCSVRVCAFAHVCVCVCVCVRVCVCVCVLCASVVCACMCVQACVHVCLCVLVHAIFLCVWACVLRSAWQPQCAQWAIGPNGQRKAALAPAHVHRHTCKHTHMHTRTPPPPRQTHARTHTHTHTHSLTCCLTAPGRSSVSHTATKTDRFESAWELMPWAAPSWTRSTLHVGMGSP